MSNVSYNGYVLDKEGGYIVVFGGCPHPGPELVNKAKAIVVEQVNELLYHSDHHGENDLFKLYPNDNFGLHLELVAGKNHTEVIRHIFAHSYGTQDYMPMAVCEDLCERLETKEYMLIAAQIFPMLTFLRKHD